MKMVGLEPRDRSSPSDQEFAPGPESPSDLRQIVGRFWARKLFIFCTALVGAGLAFAAAKAITPTYTGEARVMIKPQQGSEPAAARLLAAIQSGPEAVPSEALVLQSRSLAMRAIEQLGLDQDPEVRLDGKGLSGTAGYIEAVKLIEAVIGGSPSERSGDNATSAAPGKSEAAHQVSPAVVNAFMGQLEVELVPHTSVIRVAFRSARPAIAASVPNTIVRLYLDGLVAEKSKEMAKELNRIDEVILPELRRKLLSSQAELPIYQKYLAYSIDIRSNIDQVQADAEFISRAEVPMRPSFPKPKLMTILGAALGASLALALVVIFDAWRSGIRSIAEAEAVLGVRCLGAVPLVKLGFRRGLRSLPLQVRDELFKNAVRSIQLKLRSARGANSQTLLITSALPGEGNRSARGTNSQALLITSALPGEGKSWAAVALTSSLADDGLGAIVVDCDFFRPALHRYFGVGEVEGLTDYFADEVALDEVIRTDKNSGIHFITAGISPTKKQFITLEKLRIFMDRLLSTYKFVILDSSPILAASETMMLSQIAERTLLVVKWESTRTDVARHALRQLEEVGARVSVILSKVNPKRAGWYGDVVSSVYGQLEGYRRSTRV